MEWRWMGLGAESGRLVVESHRIETFWCGRNVAAEGRGDVQRAPVQKSLQLGKSRVLRHQYVERLDCLLYTGRCTTPVESI